MLSRVLSRFREPPPVPVEEGFEARTVRHQYGPVRLSPHIGDPNGESWYDVDRYPKPFVGEGRDVATDRFYLTAIAKDPPA